ncbi:MAG TPA: hypothetical protein VN867_01770 [Candidatus Binataceae bacterium]|nr:hypothetical protein [Candidatus Binataceae bacterium]
MNHAGNVVERPWGWALGLWMISLVMMVWGSANIQNSRQIQTNFAAFEHSIMSLWNEGAVTAQLSTTRYEALPIVLTTPFAVIRTQRMMVAKLKHRTEFANRVTKFRASIKSSPSLLTSLALLQASQYSH